MTRLRLALSERIVLDLCGGTGAWSQPYQNAGYDVRLVTLPGQDVRTFEPPAGVHGILAAPPCTEFAVSGARWWKSKPPHLLVEAVEIWSACMRIITKAAPTWWALENPVGRLRKWAGPPTWTWEPWEFGNCWLKRTCIWGDHQIPIKRPCCKPKGGAGRWRASLTNHLSPKPTAEQIARLVKDGMIPADWVHRLGPSPERATLRSITPPGFARAFFEANP
jgi:hypothetical protein